MTYSFTQISQYLTCPRRYRHRYLDGWVEKDTRAAMLFGRAFEKALAAYFKREDAAAVLYREWAVYQTQALRYSERDSWDRMLQQGRALFVLSKIDEILAWEQRKEAEKDTRFVELGRYLCEVRAGQYWRVEKLKSFDEFLERRFPESRRKAYYLMSIHEHLPAPVKRELKQVGWTKGLELAKLARRKEGQEFDCATWLHKARELPKEEFRREVEKELTGKDTEASEIVYFKLYKSQIPVVEQAIETAALMLGTGKSRGYCLEMICADFLAGANLDDGNPEILLHSISRFFNFLPERQRAAFVERIRENAS